MFDKEKCKDCYHYIQSRVLKDVIQDLIKWGFRNKTEDEKKKHPVWDKYEDKGEKK